MEVLPENLFTSRIKVLIELVGSAEKLARLTGISSRAIGKYLCGDTDPSRERLISLANAAGVNVAWLATGEGEMRRGETGGNEPAVLADPVAQDKAAQYADMLITVQNQELERLKNVIDFLQKEIEELRAQNGELMENLLPEIQTVKNVVVNAVLPLIQDTLIRPSNGPLEPREKNRGGGGGNFTEVTFKGGSTRHKLPGKRP